MNGKTEKRKVLRRWKLIVRQRCYSYKYKVIVMKTCAMVVYACTHIVYTYE